MWTSVCSKAFYDRYMQMQHERFADEFEDISSELRQARLQEFAGQEA